MKKRICHVTCNILAGAVPLSSSQPQQDNVFPLSGLTGSSLVAVARLDNFQAIPKLWGTLWWNYSWNCTLRREEVPVASRSTTSHLLFEPNFKTMAIATQLAMSASSFFCPTTVAFKQVGPSSTQSACGSFATPTTLVVCQQDNTERQTIDVSRRLFAVAAASATALGVFVQPEAQAKRNKPPPPEEKKKEEDKNLSAYDARLLANAKRKEAMKASVEAAKLKAKSIASAE